MPRLKPPFFPAAKGLYLQPTIVNNVETLSNLPWIIDEGGAAFRDLGAPTSTGMRMFAVSRPRQPAGRVRGAERRHDVPRAVRRARVLRRRPRRSHAEGVRPRRRVRAVVLRRAPRPAARQADRRQGRLHARLGGHRRDGRDDRPREGRAGGSCASSPASRAASARRAARARRGWSASSPASSRASGRREDLDLLLDVCDNISPGILWPPRQTTICPLGPSAVSPIMSVLPRFRDELEHYIEHGRPIDGVEYHEPVHV